MSAEEKLPPAEEQSVQEFAAALGIGPGTPADVAAAQGYGAGLADGAADQEIAGAYFRGRRDEREAAEIRRRSMAAHPSALGPTSPPRSAIVRTIVLEGLAVGVAWIAGSLLGELAARSAAQ